MNSKEMLRLVRESDPQPRKGRFYVPARLEDANLIIARESA